MHDMTQMSVESACLLLGVPLDTDEAGLKSARKTAALLLHPDRLVGSSPEVIRAGEFRMKQVNEAHDMLHRRLQSGTASAPDRTPPPSPSGPMLSCAKCGHPQLVRAADVVSACAICRTPLFQMVCAGCRKPTSVWGAGTWVCGCGRQNKNLEVIVRNG
jgi:hypothetical protein